MMKKTNRILCFVAAFLSILVISWAIVTYTAAFHRNKTQSAESTWWNTRLPDLSGAPQSLARYQGKPLIVNFWASWCTSCRSEMPILLKAYREYAPQGVQFIGIAVDSAANTRQFVQQNGVPYSLYIAGFAGTDLARGLGNTQGGLPFTVIFDASGRIRHTVLGRLELSELRQQLEDF